MGWRTSSARTFPRPSEFWISGTRRSTWSNWANRSIRATKMRESVGPMTCAITHKLDAHTTARLRDASPGAGLQVVVGQYVADTPRDGDGRAFLARTDGIGSNDSLNSHGGGDPEFPRRRRSWIPAFAGMTDGPPPTTHHPPPTTHHPPPTTHYPLPTTHNPLPTAHCPLPTTHYPPPTTPPGPDEPRPPWSTRRRSAARWPVRCGRAARGGVRVRGSPGSRRAGRTDRPPPCRPT
jgi:hypothetical protein